VFLKRHDLRGALSELKRAVALNPDEGEHHAALAWALWLGATDKAAALAEVSAALAKALELAPRDYHAHFYRAEVALALGKEPEALVSYQRVLALDEHNVDAQRAVRLITTRIDKKGGGKKSGLLDRLRGK
jgi:Tfp pilus assembly protein PilF